MAKRVDDMDVSTYTAVNTTDDSNDDWKEVGVDKSSSIKQNLLFISITFPLLIIVIVILFIQPNLTEVSSILIWISIVSLVGFIGICLINICVVKRTMKNDHSFQNESPNVLTLGVVNITSISLTIFTVLFISSVMLFSDFPSNWFTTFLLLNICVTTTIWILTVLMYVLLSLYYLIGNACFSIRQNIPLKSIAFLIASFITCPLFMLSTGLATDAILLSFGLGIVLSLSVTLIIVGITNAVLCSGKKRRFLYCFLSIIGIVGMIVILWFYLIDGYDMKIDVNIPSDRYPKNITNDPSLIEKNSISFLTYGNGFDHRSDYGINATIITPTINLSSLIRLSSFNKKFFGFNESFLPLNGRIWYPKNKTNQYPLILMVHGNHLSTESSEQGYDYLGEMLAKQAFIVLSIDQNFLNGDVSFIDSEYGKINEMKKYLVGSIMKPELIVRAILLLETLKQVRLWNEDKTNEFYNQIDLLNIGLMGHSRGGEAIVLAYLFNSLSHLPEYPSDILFLNYHFQIKVLFSISGIDQSYMPLGHHLQFSDVTLFALHGIYDSDVTSFLFQSKLTHLKFTSNTKKYHFKASLYVHQANHGQFNTKWGKYDFTSAIKYFLNVRPLININEQKHLCQIYMSALMNLVLKNQTQYQILFEDYRSGLSFLPFTNYRSTFEDSNDIIINDFENYDVTHATITNSNVTVDNLSLWGSVYIKLYDSTMLLLQPINNSTIGKYSIQLQHPIKGSALRFLIVRPKNGLVDYLTVRIFYQNGKHHQSYSVNVPSALPRQLFKLSSTEYITALQTMSLPLSHPIVGLQFQINGTNAQFLIDNIVIAK